MTAPQLTPIHAGQPYLRRVQGGVIKTPAPTDGLLVTSGEVTVYVPEDAIRAALRALTSNK